MRYEPIATPKAVPVSPAKAEDPASAYWTATPSPARPLRPTDALEQMFAYYDAA